MCVARVETGVRFDDSLRTVLAGLAQGAIGPEAAWRQLVDLVAQGRDGPRLEDALHALDLLRLDVPADVRAAIAGSFAHRPVSPRLVAVFAGDRLAIAAPLLGSVRLREEEWLQLVPRLGPSLRALLRHRRDLGPAVERALANFGASDLIVDAPADRVLADDPAAAPDLQEVAEALEVAPPPVALEPADNDPPPSSDGAQIRELLERIESFRQQRAEQAPPGAGEDGFSFETDAQGLISWVDGVPREALIGTTIASPAQADCGVDGQAAGAFRRRAPFRSARLTVPGIGPAAGDWRISGVPFFEPASGRFGGYRGSARRPRRDEVAGESGASGLFGGGLSPDSLRQLVHELRTPLNAIQGFADMIEGQMLGPAGEGYRDRAGEIAGQARRLLGAVDDLDLAARVETDRLPEDGGHVDGVALLCRLHAEYLPLARERGVELRFTLAERLPHLALAPAAAERIMGRLLAATIGLAAPGETVAIAFDREGAGSGLRLGVSRPRTLRGVSDAELLDPGYIPPGDWPDAPALGLGFALRLVSNLARANGGRLTVLADTFALQLPAAADASAGGRQSG